VYPAFCSRHTMNTDPLRNLSVRTWSALYNQGIHDLNALRRAYHDGTLIRAKRPVKGWRNSGQKSYEEICKLLKLPFQDPKARCPYCGQAIMPKNELP